MGSKISELFSDPSFLALINNQRANGAVPFVAPKNSASITVKAPNPGSGGETCDDSHITFTPHAALYVDGRVRSESRFPSGRSGVVEFDAGQSGTLKLDMKIEG